MKYNLKVFLLLERKRSMNWRADQPASLYYVEALDGGDPNTKAEYRDEIFVWNFPFDNSKFIMKTKQRYAGIILATKSIWWFTILGMIHARKKHIW